MSQTRRLALAATALAFAAALPTSAHAQDDTMGPSRVSIEGFLAQYQFDTPGGDREGLGGVGVRAMLGRGDVTGTLNSFFQRAKAGVFLVYTAEKNNVSTMNFGGQADFPLFAAPVASGYLDPFFSLGLGGFRTKIDVPSGTGVPEGFSATSTDFAVTPAIGTLIPLTGAIKFRGDIRDVIIFGDERTNNFLFEGGISVGF
jgi:hypothetical protein